MIRTWHLWATWSEMVMDEVFEDVTNCYDIFSPKPDRLGDVSADVKLSASTRSISKNSKL
jgi:hypothetical protein